MHTKKYRASPLTDKKKSNSVRRREKNIEQTENLPTPPPIKNQMVRPLECCTGIAGPPEDLVLHFSQLFLVRS